MIFEIIISPLTGGRADRSVGRSVGRSVSRRRSLGRSVGRSIGRQVSRPIHARQKRVPLLCRGGPVVVLGYLAVVPL